MAKNPKQAKPLVSPRRRLAAKLVSGFVAICFGMTVALIVEARQTSFYGEPLSEKMIALARIHVYGLPQDKESRAQVRSGIPDLNLLPPEAVLPKEMADRFARIGIDFAYVQKDVRPGNGHYRCHATDISLIPAAATSIAAALNGIPDDALVALHLQTIIFCGDLYDDWQKVGGFPVPVNDLMMLNLTHRTEDGDIRKLFTHEFYHLFEARYGITSDTRWNTMFPDGYLNRSYTGAANSVIGSGQPGFLNRYSQTYPYEDRAEIFANLMTNRTQLMQYVRDRQDNVLYAKVGYVADTARLLLKIKIDPL